MSIIFLLIKETHYTCNFFRMKTKGEKVESQLSHAEEVKLKKKVGTAEKVISLSPIQLATPFSFQKFKYIDMNFCRSSD